MSQIKKSILFLIFFTGSTNIIRTFASDKVSKSSSPCSSLSSLNCSSSSSSFISSISSCRAKTDYMKDFSDYQKKVIAKMIIMKEFTNFPQGIVPMITSYLSAEQQTKDLNNALEDETLTPEKRLKNIKEAIACGAEVNNPVSDLLDSSPLCLALNLSFEKEFVFEIVKELIDAGANVNEKWMIDLHIYCTPLKLALHQAHKKYTTLYKYKKAFKIIELLLKNDADPNINELQSVLYCTLTPLICHVDDPEMIQLLLNYDADPSIGTNDRGETFDVIVKRYPKSEKIYKKYLERKAKKEEPKACVIS